MDFDGIEMEKTGLNNDLQGFRWNRNAMNEARDFDGIEMQITGPDTHYPGGGPLWSEIGDQENRPPDLFGIRRLSDHLSTKMYSPGKNLPQYLHHRWHR